MNEDKIISKMIEDRDYLEPIFQSYIDWVSGKSDKLNINRDTAYKMLEVVSDMMDIISIKHPNAYDNIPSYINDDPWATYNGFEEDKYLYSYYAYIEGNISNLLIQGYFD